MLNIPFVSPLFCLQSIYFFSVDSLGKLHVLYRGSYKFKLPYPLNLNWPTGLLVTDVIMLLHSLQMDCLAIVYLWQAQYIHQKPFIGMLTCTKYS